jgi:hypothetical protein
MRHEADSSSERGLTADIARLARNVVDEQPFVLVGAAAGLGFLAGGGLPRGAGAVLLSGIARAGAAWLAGELSHRNRNGRDSQGEEEGDHG